MHSYDPARPRSSRCAARCARPSSARRSRGLNFLFSDGERLYAYRLGLFELHWLRRARPAAGGLGEASPTSRGTASQQDVLLTLDPDDLEEPHAERLLGDELRRPGRDPQDRHRAHLRGAERGAVAAERARDGSGGGCRVSRRFALLVNPASAGGKALEALPAVHADARRASAPPTAR